MLKEGDVLGGQLGFGLILGFIVAEYRESDAISGFCLTVFVETEQVLGLADFHGGLASALELVWGKVALL